MFLIHLPMTNHGNISRVQRYKIIRCIEIAFCEPIKIPLVSCMLRKIRRVDKESPIIISLLMGENSNKVVNIRLITPKILIKRLDWKIYSSMMLLSLKIQADILYKNSFIPK